MITPDQLASHSGELAALAESWLASGATEFSVWSAGQPIRRWAAGGAEAQATLCAPIEIGAQLVGQLHVAIDHGGAGHQHKLDAEARLLARLLRQDTHLEQMTAELVEAQDQLLALYDLTQATRSQLGTGETLRLLAGEAARLVHSEGALMLLNPMLVQYPRPLIDDVTLIGYFGELQASQRELLLNEDSGASFPAGLYNACMIPIRVRGTITAMLGLMNKPGGFAAPDLKLARAIAEHAGTQIEHALLHQETLAQARLQAEMEVARKVQLQMLPQHRPQHRDLDVFADSRPAQEVGGDFYDFIQQPDRPLILILGDVSGKGISAALIMGMIHAITNSAARFMPRPEPAAILSRANEYLYDDFSTLDTFATAFVACYQPESQIMQYANAGHAPVLYRPAGGAARMLEADGVPVGVLPISLCENQTIDFGPGDVLVVATDGFSEANNPRGELFGYERLLQLLDQAADQPAQVIAKMLFDAIYDFSSGRPQDDDQTVIVIKGVERGTDS